MAGAPFLFGKLPAHGDFVARGLSDAERDRWDAWSAAALEALRAAAGDGFETAHGEAPPWRFVTGAGGRWLAGALAPSMDGAGRRFLLAVGLDGLGPAQAAAFGLQAAAEAEALIYEGLAEGLDADTLHGRASERFADLDAAAADAAEALGARADGPGAWWTLGSPTAPAQAIRTGVAPADLFARTLSPSLEPAA